VSKFNLNKAENSRKLGELGMKTKIALLVTAAFAASFTTPLRAQDAAPATETKEGETEGEGEGIIVTGIRGSLQKAADIKKESSQIVDVITAEDVGKLPDANVAEALQRVTGVQITRVFGEGQAINIRGLQQTRVEVDGRTLLGWSARVSPPENDNLGRSSGLDAVPSSLFGRLEVRKSPLSSQVEGGLGGTVNLVTPKPFDFKKTTISLRAQGTYSDQSDKFEPNLSGLFSTTFADGNIGVLVSAEYQKRTSKLQLFERNNWFSVLNGQPATTGGQPTPRVLVPRLLQYENTDIDRTRFGINGALQFRVGDDLVITADALYSKQLANRTNQFVALNLANSATALVVANPTIVDGYALAGVARGNIRTGSQIRKDPTASYLYGLNAKYENDDGFSVNVDGYYSKGTLRQKIEVITLQTANNAVDGVFDFRNGVVPDLRVVVPGSVTAANPTGTAFDLTSTTNFPLPRTDRLTYRANLLPGDPLFRNSARDYDLTERTISGYLMFDAETEIFGMRTKANAGVRLSSTDFVVDTLSQVGTGPLTPTRNINKYTNVLPSANVTFNVTDDFLVRFSASQTLQRAGLADLAPSTFVDATNRTSSGGNADLTPPISSNLDMSFEYYTGRSSLISGALFYKDVQDFIITNTTQQIIPGFVGLGTIRVQKPENVASAKVKGFEIGVQQFFDFLPSPFDGLGIIANYTYADSKDSNGFPLVATSKHSYNLVGLFEKGPISARIAYNWRDDAVFEFTEGRPDVIAARAQLDAQFGIDLTNQIALSFQAQNLLPRESATVEISNFNEQAINSYALSERRFSVGLRVKF
jgi:outer membrane receptor protein involved in Fe transport